MLQSLRQPDGEKLAGLLLSHLERQVLSVTHLQFRELLDKLFVDTVEYKVLQAFLGVQTPLSLHAIAENCGFSKSATLQYRKRGRCYTGGVRRAINRMCESGLLLKSGDGKRLKYKLNLQDPNVQLLLAVFGAPNNLE